MIHHLNPTKDMLFDPMLIGAMPFSLIHIVAIIINIYILIIINIYTDYSVSRYFLRAQSFFFVVDQLM